MAIKIDLLPGYVKLRRDLHRSIAACIVATCVVVSGLMFALKKKQLDLETATTNLQVMTAVATQATAAQTEATNAQTASAPVENAVAFMTAASKTGPQRAALLDMVRDAINEDTIVRKIDISDANNVIIEATVRTPDEYRAFLLNLRRASAEQGGLLFEKNPTANGVGGFANGAAPFLMPTSPNGEPVPIVFPINVIATGSLLTKIYIPQDPTGGAAPAAGATGATGLGGGLTPPAAVPATPAA
jgi:hypothetical protein